MRDREIAAIAIGSNMGDRAGNLAFAFSRLASFLQDFRASSVVETAPVGVPDVQPNFLNAAAVGTFDGSPQELMSVLLGIEQEAGRVRPFAGAARTLDLDLILFGSEILLGDRLTVPHPRFRDRAFVLAPLAEVAPDLMDPESGLTIRELLRKLEHPEADPHR